MDLPKGIEGFITGVLLFCSMAGMAEIPSNEFRIKLDQAIEMIRKDSLLQAQRFMEELGENPEIGEVQRIQLKAKQAVCEMYLGNYRRALEFNFEVLICLEFMDTSQVSLLEMKASVLTNAGVVFYYQHDYEQALLYYKRGLEIEHRLIQLNPESEIYMDGLSAGYNNVANVMVVKKQYPEALDYHNRSLILAKKLHRKESIASSLNNIGGIYQFMWEENRDSSSLNKAYQNFNEALKIAREIGNLRQEAMFLVHLSNLDFELNKLDSVEVYSLKSKLIATQIGNREILKQSLDNLYRYYKKMGATEQALFHLEQFAILSDSLKNQQNNEAIAEMEVKYQTSKKDHELQLLTKSNQIQNLEINLLIVLVGVVFLLLILVWVLWKRWKYRTKHRMIELEQRLLRAQMNPHFIFNALNSIQASILSEDLETAYAYHARFSKLLRLFLEHSREGNVILTDELKALKLYMELEAYRMDFKFVPEIEIMPGVNTDEFLIPVMMLQPHVENAIWHGVSHLDRDGKVQVRVDLKGEFLEVEIWDNGVGKERSGVLERTGQKEKRTSLAQQIMHERMALLDRKAKHKFSFISEQLTVNGRVEGTRVVVRLPIDQIKLK